MTHMFNISYFAFKRPIRHYAQIFDNIEYDAIINEIIKMPLRPSGSVFGTNVKNKNPCLQRVNIEKSSRRVGRVLRPT